MTNSPRFPDEMLLDQAVPSQNNYLCKEDVTQPVLAQIAYMAPEQIESQGRMQTKSVLHFHGDIKPLILNQTNKEILKLVTGAQTVGQLRDQQVVLYCDPMVNFGGRAVGGIRIRRPAA